MEVPKFSTATLTDPAVVDTRGVGTDVRVFQQMDAVHNRSVGTVERNFSNAFNQTDETSTRAFGMYTGEHNRVVDKITSVHEQDLGWCQ